MVSGKPLFTGVNENDQLKKIFKIMGTPNVKTYPDIVNLPEWNPDNFEVYPTQDLKKFVPTLEQDGLDLLKKMLVVDPAERITCDLALEHKYFNEIQDSVVKDLYK